MSILSRCVRAGCVAVLLAGGTAAGVLAPVTASAQTVPAAASESDLPAFREALETINIFDFLKAGTVSGASNSKTWTNKSQGERDASMIALGRELDARHDAIMTTMSSAMLPQFSHGEILQLSRLSREPVMTRFNAAMSVLAQGDASALRDWAHAPETTSLSPDDKAVLDKVILSMTLAMEAVKPEVEAAMLAVILNSR